MKFQRKSALAYMFRNFWHLAYVTLPVSVLMAFFVNASKEIDFLQMLARGEIERGNLMERFVRAVTVLRFGRLWWVDLIALLLLAFTVSLLAVKIERHMRVGVMPALPFKRAFAFFPVTLLLITCYFVAYEVTLLLGVGVTYVLRFWDIPVIAASVGVVTCFVLRLLMSWIFTLLILAVPLIYSDNYHLNVALSYSVRIMSKQRKLAWGLSFLYALCRCMVVFLCYLLRPYGLDALVNAVSYFALITYLPCLAFKLFYGNVGAERRDISQYAYY